MKQIVKAHGSGGKLTRQLIDDIFRKNFSNQILDALNDAALLPKFDGQLAFTTDSHVIKPLFYPGGDIGKLAVSGTVNDLAVSGAVPKYLSCGFILEEGFGIEKLTQIVQSMAVTAQQAGVQIVTGDTKVVSKGEADGIYINTSGIGMYPEPVQKKQIVPGDKIILSGKIGAHATAILLAREKFMIKSKIESDCQPVNRLTEKLFARLSSIKIMRDPTRGGLATVLNEFVEDKNVGIRIKEELIPVSESVRGICEPFGFDPLYLANEGKFVFVVSEAEADTALAILTDDNIGRNAAIIGEVIEKPTGRVLLETELGAHRVLNLLANEILPRIC